MIFRALAVAGSSLSSSPTSWNRGAAGDSTRSAHPAVEVRRRPRQSAHGWSAEELLFQHPYLSLGQIHSALAYYTGTRLQVELLPDRAFKVSVTRADHTDQVESLAGSLAHRNQQMAPAQEQAAILQAVRADDERTKGTARHRR